jgi:hypothetical protein
MPRESRQGTHEPPGEILAAGAAGLIFLLIGANRGGIIGGRLALVGLVVVIVAALVFFLRLIVWLRHRDPPAR